MAAFAEPTGHLAKCLMRTTFHGYLVIIGQLHFAEGKLRQGKAQGPKMASLFSLSLEFPLSLQLQVPLATPLLDLGSAVSSQAGGDPRESPIVFEVL